MSFKFKHRKARLVEGDFIEGDQTLHIWVNADKLSGAKMKEIKAKIAGAKKVDADDIDTRGIEFMSEMLELLIDKWDADDAKPTAEFFMGIGTFFVRDLLDYCTGLITPKAQTASA